MTDQSQNQSQNQSHEYSFDLVFGKDNPSTYLKRLLLNQAGTLGEAANLKKVFEGKNIKLMDANILLRNIVWAITTREELEVLAKTEEEIYLQTCFALSLLTHAPYDIPANIPTDEIFISFA